MAAALVARRHGRVPSHRCSPPRPRGLRERGLPIDVIVSRSANPPVGNGAVVHRSRAELAPHVTAVDGIPVLTIAATLALLTLLAGPARDHAGVAGRAVRAGVTTTELRDVALAWRRRGRAGPAALLGMLGESDYDRLPTGWFRQVAARVLTRFGVRLVDGFPVGDVELDLADPTRRIGVADGRSADAARRARLREAAGTWSTSGGTTATSPSACIDELATLLASCWPPRR